MAPAANNHHHAPLFRRFVAAVSIALLLLLSAAAVSPALHEHLHEHDSDHASPAHSCAVVLFATGLVLAAACFHMGPRFAPHACALTPTLLFLPASAHHLQPPGRAPPAC